MTNTAEPTLARIRAARPYLTIRDAAGALEFYRRAFGAVETGERYTEADGRIGHAAFRVGEALIMISDEYPELDVRGPQSLGGASSGLVLEVEDANGVFERAVAAGAEVLRPLRDEPYGRTGKLRDPFGHVWFVNGPVRADT